MCRQFSIPLPHELYHELSRLTDERRIRTILEAWEHQGVAFGENIFPEHCAPAIMLDDEGHITKAVLKWGFPGFDGKPIINTRLESAAEKPLWREAFHERRCVVPAAAFYEYHGEERGMNPKNRKTVRQIYRFETPSEEPMLIAGLWQEGCFSMLTTEPNGFVRQVHSRMPLVLRREEVYGWLKGLKGDEDLRNRSDVILKAAPCFLPVPEQGTLF